MTILFTAIGPVRGGCGHKHKTASAAKRCLRRDQHQCLVAGGYSDRKIYPYSAQEYRFAPGWGRVRADGLLPLVEEDDVD